MRKKIASGLLACVVAAVGAAGVLSAQMAPPKDARYTLFLMRFEGPSHVREAKKAKEFLEKETGMKGFFLVHLEGVSGLHYGYYKTVSEREDEREARRMRADLDRFTVLVVNGEKPFAGAIPIQLPTPDPVAPADWDIRNSKGVFSLQVGVYTEHADRKEAAVAAVKQAREMGLEAYYYHGATSSAVLLGSFPETALRFENVGNPSDPSQGIRTENAEQGLLVLPFVPSGVPEEIVRPDGSKTKVVAPKVIVTDPLLQDLCRRFPHHAVNGEEKVIDRSVDPRTGKVTVRMQDSLIVRVSDIRRQSLLGAGAAEIQAKPADAPDRSTVAPKPSTPGSGKLKEVR